MLIDDTVNQYYENMSVMLYILSEQIYFLIMIFNYFKKFYYIFSLKMILRDKI